MVQKAVLNSKPINISDFYFTLLLTVMNKRNINGIKKTSVLNFHSVSSW